MQSSPRDIELQDVNSFSSSYSADRQTDSPPPEHSGKIIPAGSDSSSSCYPGETIHIGAFDDFHNKLSPSPTDSSTLGSRQNHHQSSPPIGTQSSLLISQDEQEKPAQMIMHPQAFIRNQRSYPFMLDSNQTINFPSEKLQKARAKKERKEKRQNKTVKTSYVQKTANGDNSFNIDEVLESLGETKVENGNKKKSKKQAAAGKPAASDQTKKDSSKRAKQTRNRSKDNKTSSSVASSNSSSSISSIPSATADEEIKKNNNDNESKEESELSSILQKSDNEESTEINDSNANYHPNSSSATSPLNIADEVDLIDLSEPVVSDKTLDNQNFTTVTKKKWKKKASGHSDDVNSNHVSSKPSLNYKTSLNNDRGYRGVSVDFNSNSVNTLPHNQMSQDSSRSSSTSHTERMNSASTVPSRQDNPVQKQPDQNQVETPKLDLSADFPPLASEPDSDEVFNNNNINSNSNERDTSKDDPNDKKISSVTENPEKDSIIWPSVSEKSSDLKAVIGKDELVDSKVEPEEELNANVGGEIGGPPDICFREASGSAVRSSLPDVAAQAPLNNGAASDYSSGQNTPQSQRHSTRTNENRHIDECSILSSRNSTASFFLDTDNNVEIVLTEEEYNRRREIGAAPVVILGKGANPIQDWSATPEGLEFGFDLNESLLTPCEIPVLENGDVLGYHEKCTAVSANDSIEKTSQDLKQISEGTEDEAIPEENATSERSTPTPLCESDAPEPSAVEVEKGLKDKVQNDFRHKNYLDLVNMLQSTWSNVQNELTSNGENSVVYFEDA